MDVFVELDNVLVLFISVMLRQIRGTTMIDEGWTEVASKPNSNVLTYRTSYVWCNMIQAIPRHDVRAQS
jgi:hypothetical protein